jgi:1-acyl-sn-glycerol-3-phosphate acyltransferase
MSTGRDVSAEDLRRFSDALAGIPVRQGWLERSLRLAIRGWCRIVAWRVSVEGVGHLPVRDGDPGAGCVVAATPHRAWVEPFLLVAAWPADAARLVWLADGRTVTRSWWRRRLLPRLGVIPIAATSGGPQAYAELAALACADGHAVVVFPEIGPPASSDRTRRISPGFAYLALRAGAPVVPVVVGGTHHIVRGSSFSVDVLPALESAGSVDDPFTSVGRVQAHALAREFHDTVAEVLPKRTAQADAAAPSRDRWTWLATLFG